MRLIDADDFFARMENDTDLCAEMETDGLKALKKYLDMQSTAYDIDKVVEELKALEGVQFDGENESYQLNWCIETNRAIEIVKQCGVYDDVCEWESVSDGEFIQNPHTKRLYSNEPSMKNVYCNTCRKKIRIVGD